MQYINYNELNKFYTIENLCKLLDMSKDNLHEKIGYRCPLYRNS